jgi:hypothetical protein
LEFDVREGLATFAKLTREYDKMSVTAGTFVSPDRARMRGGIGEAVMSSDAAHYLKSLIREGFEHHVCAVHGDVRVELAKVCEVAAIQQLAF